MPVSSTLFGPSVPDGFGYQADLVTPAEERNLVAHIQQIEFADVVMRGAVAKRRTAHFGFTYGYEARRTEPGVPLPDFLLPLRTRAAVWAELPADTLAEALITEYSAGAAIGWHRDAPMFEDIIGVSLLTACRMKLRPYVSPADVGALAGKARRTAHEIELEPRSAYVIRGEARTAYEHHIPAVGALRYSITFRSLRCRG
jgi:alkylated DNA repair dioxygenase AlkB